MNKADLNLKKRKLLESESPECIPNELNPENSLALIKPDEESIPGLLLLDHENLMDVAYISEWNKVVDPINFKC